VITPSTPSNALVINGPVLYPKQYRAIMDPARHCFIEASTKAGKTFGCIVWQFAQCCAHEGRRHHWWVAPVYKQARIAYERAKEYIPKQAIKSINDGEMFIRLINGATWTFKSGEKPDNLFGEDVYSVVIDEASRCRDAVWQAIRSTLTATRGSTRVIGNVKGRKNWFFRLSRRAQSGVEGYAYHKLTAYDAAEGGAIAYAEIEEAKADLPDHVFRELYLADPSEDGSNPFGIKPIERANKGLTHKPVVVWGIDLAKSVDWTVLCGLDAEGNVAELQRFQRDWQSTIAFIKATVGGTPALVDSTGLGDPILEDLQSAGLDNYEGLVFTGPSKQKLMEGLALDFHRGIMTIGNEDLVDELKDFEFVHTRTGVRYSAPDGAHDDTVCALALARQHFRNNLTPSEWWT
jgi:phage FluMu gp28-like protein